MKVSDWFARKDNCRRLVGSTGSLTTISLMMTSAMLDCCSRIWTTDINKLKNYKHLILGSEFSACPSQSSD